MKVLICGLGSIGARHARNLKALGVQDLILYRTGRSTLPDTDDLSDIPVFNNLDAALELEPDAAVISNPTNLHVETAIRAASAGCHLFVEKPLSNDLEGIDELERIICEKN